MDLLKILAYLSYLATVSDAIVRYGCYSSPGSQCTNVTLKCFGNDIILLRKDIQYGTSSNNNCQSEEQCRNNLCCLPEKNHKPIRADLQDRLSMFTSCSNQQSCTVTVPYNQSLPYDYVSYSYTCLDAAVNFDISTDFNIDVKKQVYVYGNGANYSPLNSTRICKVQTETQSIAVEALYINLRSESCRKIEISSQNTTLFNCTEEQLVILSEKLDITGNQINITIRNLTLQADEFIWLEFLTDEDAEISIQCKDINHGSGSVTNCSNCSNQNGSGNADESPQGFKDLTWIIVGVSVGGGAVLVTILVIVVVHMKKKRKKNKTSKNTNRNHQSTHPNPYEDPGDITSLPMNSKPNTDRQSGEKECKSKSDTDKILSESGKKRERDNVYAHVKKTRRLYPEVPEQGPHHDSENINKSKLGDSIEDPTYNHLGETRKPENSGTSVYDHI